MGKKYICRMDPKQLQIKDFTYSLPENRIANYPLPDRDASKLLIYKDGTIKADVYRNIAGYLPEGALLILNDTRVVEARLLFQKPTGGSIEIFCLSPHSQYPDVTTAMMQKKKVWWNCIIGGASKWKHGAVLEKIINTANGDIILKALLTERLTDSFTIEMQWDPGDLSFAEILHLAGLIPLPPYIKRAAVVEDKERYQTIYAQHEGSVAAPTAGLHFTDTIFRSLSHKHIIHDFVTLHVGAGTFKPVKAERMEAHTMHAEFIDVQYDLIKKISDYAGRIFCVGTTSLRTVESIYWMGVKVKMNENIDPAELVINQWEVYETLSAQAIPVKESLDALLRWMDCRHLRRLLSETQILIAPGYPFKIISGLVTNFHQPQSTLLLLVAALMGERWRDMYQYALDNDFRFLSYGDGCLLFKETTGIP